MKKIIFPILAIIFTLSANQALAINLDKIAGAVNDATGGDKKNSNPLNQIDNITVKIEERVDKLTSRIENRVGQYEKKFDEFDKKIEKAEKATDRVINTLNSFDQGQIQKYITMAKYGAIAFALVFLTSFVLLILIFVQSCKISCTCNKLKKSA